MMKRAQHGMRSMDVAELLIPENDAEQAELLQVLDTNGVSHSMAFSKNGINGRIDFPQRLTWGSDGSLELQLTEAGTEGTQKVWFWVVELNDGTKRRFAWFSKTKDIDTAFNWS